MTSAAPSAAPSAVRGLNRADPRAPGITRVRAAGGVQYLDASGTPATDVQTLARIRALAIPPAWRHVWISPD
ncbi:MAG TPA: DNA topoisomerase IB, partial [Candidatus Binatia bacterium]|nr:DNA topoisomerase IB [Candidatus Binatia bacterium]